MISVKLVLFVLASKIALSFLNPLLRNNDDPPTRVRRGSGCKDVWRIHRAWLTDEQKEELKTLNYDGADFETLYDKVWSFYDKTEGATRSQAKSKLRDSCMSIIKNLVGEDNADELKSMKQRGAKNSQILERADELISGLEDPGKRREADKVSKLCKQVFNRSSKKKRRYQTHL